MRKLKHLMIVTNVHLIPLFAPVHSWQTLSTSYEIVTREIKCACLRQSYVIFFPRRFSLKPLNSRLEARSHYLLAVPNLPLSEDVAVLL